MMSTLHDKEAAWRAFEAWRSPRVEMAREMRPRLFEAQNWRCCYCGVYVTDIQRHDLKRLPRAERNRAVWMIGTIEHVIRRTDRGGDEWDNLVGSCEWCNVSRGERSAEEWFIEVQALIRLGAHPHGIWLNS